MATFDGTLLDVPGSLRNGTTFRDQPNAVFAIGDITGDSLTEFVTWTQGFVGEDMIGAVPHLFALQGPLGSEPVVPFSRFDVPIDIGTWQYRAMAQTGDIDGDGLADAVGYLSAPPAALGTFAPEILVSGLMFGTAAGLPPLESFDGTNGYLFLTALDPPWEVFRRRVDISIIPDGDGDGLSDILISSMMGYEGLVRLAETSHLVLSSQALAAADAADGLVDGRISVFLSARLDDVGERFIAVGAGPVFGGSGDDAVVAGTSDPLHVDFSRGGNNRVLLGAGHDTVLGGAGDDVILAGRGGNNRIDLSAGGNNRVYGGDGADTIIGGAGDDVIRPGRGDDFVDLRAGGDNFVFNLRGDATIMGGAGNDVIRGGIGDTLILAGAGTNRILAGPGRDTIGFAQEVYETRILDFRPGSDTIDFTRHDGVSGLGDLSLGSRHKSDLIVRFA